MNTYKKCAANPCGMRTYKIIGLKASWNEYLQKNGGRAGLRVRAVLAARANIVTQRISQYSGGKLVVSRAREAYDVRTRGPNWVFLDIGIVGQPGRQNGNSRVEVHL